MKLHIQVVGNIVEAIHVMGVIGTVHIVCVHYMLVITGTRSASIGLIPTDVSGTMVMAAAAVVIP